MATIHQRITNCLWFDSEAEEAAKHYTSIFPNSSLGLISHFGKEGFEFHKKPEGSIMTVMFNLDGQEFMGLNGGPDFKFNEAMSLVINCANQQEIDHYWSKLSEGGEEGYCGWLKDKFGVSWQVVAEGWAEMMSDPDKAKVSRVMVEVFKMRKPDLAVIQRAFNGK